MIYGIIGWTMIGCEMGVAVRGHSHHSIRKIIVPDCGLSLPKLMRGEVRVK
jgi:hypothetical protein